MPNILSIFVLLSCYMVIIISKCPNYCSGHGQCQSNNVCDCDDGWDQQIPDCSRSLTILILLGNILDRIMSSGSCLG